LSALICWFQRMVNEITTGILGPLPLSPRTKSKLTMSVFQLHGITLDSRLIKTGISTMTPTYLTIGFHSLPVILHINSQEPISGRLRLPIPTSLTKRVVSRAVIATNKSYCCQKPLLVTLRPHPPLSKKDLVIRPQSTEQHV
jgi:hypothetical protein